MNQLVFVSNKATPHKTHYTHHTHPSFIFRLKYPQICGPCLNNMNMNTPKLYQNTLVKLNSYLNESQNCSRLPIPNIIHRFGVIKNKNKINEKKDLSSFLNRSLCNDCNTAAVSTRVRYERSECSKYLTSC
jgi:hypothetical protein